MRREDCQLAEYQAWFQRECNQLVLKPGFTLVGPFLDAARDPAPPWSLDFAIVYDDSMYIRISENYRALSKNEGGGGCLQYFSYHYGPCTTERDEDGFPVFLEDCELRIDIDRWSKRHIHYAGENHVPEVRLPGLDFNKISPFDFIRAVEEYRATQMALHELLGFKVETAK